MRYRDAGENQTKSPPGADDGRSNLAGRAHRYGRKAIKAEGHVAADVAIETAGDVPERRAQQQANQQEGQPQDKAIVVKLRDVALCSA